jgi:hypothetical protein
MTRKWSSFRRWEPLSKHDPQVSSKVQTNLTLKKSSTASMGLSRPGTGKPSASIQISVLATTRSIKHVPWPKDMRDHNTSNITDELTTRYIYNSPRYLTVEILRWLNLNILSCTIYEYGSPCPGQFQLTSIPILISSMTWSRTAIPNSIWYRCKSYTSAATKGILPNLISHISVKEVRT